MPQDPISSYSSQSISSDAGWSQGFSRQMLSARVSTRTVGVQLGKLGVSLSTQKISFVDEPAPKILKDFAQELELQQLTQHVRPFRPAGGTSPNANTQRLGATAYSQQANFRSASPMINVVV